METEDRAPAPGIDALLQNACKLDFYEAARRIDCAAEGKPRIGQAAMAADDPVQFGQQPSLRFAPAAIHHYEPGTDRHKARLMVTFFGLLGPNGPLPLHLTDYVHDRELNAGDPTIGRFFDIFNHRMISLLYRAWACNQPTVSYDRPDEDEFARYIGSLFGLGEESLRGQDAIQDIAKLHYSGHLVCQNRHAEGLRALLAEYFRMPVQIEQFVGEWIPLDKCYLTRLGESRDTGVMGSTVIAGSKTWERSNRFRIRMGPMGLHDYERMLPEGESFGRLRAWIRNYVGDALSWEAQLILRAEDVPTTQLGTAGRMGWSTWLRSTPAESDSDDMVLRPD